MYLTVLLLFFCAALTGSQDALEINKNTGTIDEPEDVDLVADAWALRGAMKGWGTNEKTIINILGARSYDNRMSLSRVYRDEVGRNLWSDLVAENSGHFLHTLQGLVLPEGHFFAKELSKAVKGWGTNEDAVLHCLMLTMPDYELVQEMKDYYIIFYKQTLSVRLKSETRDSPNFLRFIIGVLNRPKFNESAPLDTAAVDSDVGDLKEFLADYNEKDTVDLLVSRSLTHLSALQEAYFQDTGDELYTKLEGISDHHLRDGFVSLMSVSSDFIRYCAYELWASMKGTGTDEDSLDRIITTRADKDLKLIIEAFEDMEIVSGTLISWIKSETSGDHERMLVKLVEHFYS